MARLKTPAEAAKELGISRATITRCKQMGAPVHYVGTCGRLYRIDPDELAAWMNAQGEKDKEEKERQMTLLELRARRHAMVG